MMGSQAHHSTGDVWEMGSALSRREAGKARKARRAEAARKARLNSKMGSALSRREAGKARKARRAEAARKARLNSKQGVDMLLRTPWAARSRTTEVRSHTLTLSYDTDLKSYPIAVSYFNVDHSHSTLLDLGASPDYKDSRGLTPLYHSSMVGGDPYCCELLLHDHAQVGCVDENGWQEIHQKALICSARRRERPEASPEGPARTEIKTVRKSRAVLPLTAHKGTEAGAFEGVGGEHFELSESFVSMVQKQCMELKATRASPSRPPVDVTVYYDSLCPGCRGFLTQRLFPAWTMLQDIMTLTLVPYGNVQCVELYAPVLSWAAVEDCARGEQGVQLMRDHAARTRGLNPTHTHVPWVTFHGGGKPPVCTGAQVKLDRSLCSV
ncbi:hypothetical protein CRUP_016978 [Coryphaenoides rupestris]|nr:hypothetical protein CRUP_016978 [Coryphaenoides rupestris]